MSFLSQVQLLILCEFLSPPHSSTVVMSFATCELSKLSAITVLRDHSSDQVVQELKPIDWESRKQFLLRDAFLGLFLVCVAQ